MEVLIQTECACCAKPISMTIDSEMTIRVHQRDASPLIFIPDVDFAALGDAGIIEAF